jgi:L-seryl-tRNA(Ser) seleniumtransferase
MTLAALEATLRIYLDLDRALREVPGLRMLGTPPADLRRSAEALAERLRTIDALASVTVAEDVAYVGGGSLPDQKMPSWVVEVAARGVSDTDLAQRLRVGDPAVVGRLRDGKLVLDVRTVLPHQEDALVGAIRQAAAGA